MSKRVQWIIAAVLALGWLAYASFEDDEDEVADASPSLAQFGGAAAGSGAGPNPVVAAPPLGAAPQPVQAGQAAPAMQPAPQQFSVSPPPSQPPLAALPPLPPMFDTNRLQEVVLRDERGQESEVVALPHGWQLTNKIEWNDQTGCVGNMLQRSWSMIAPDSLTMISVMPGFGWQLAGTQIPTDPCPPLPLRGVREVLEATVQQIRPGAQLYDYQDMTAEFEVEARRQGPPPSPVMPGQVASREAGRLLIGYQQDGVEMREVLAAVANKTTYQGHVLMSVSGISSIRGPAGRVDLAALERVISAGRPNQQWMEFFKQRVKHNMDRFYAGQTQQINDWHQRQMAIINARGAAERHAIRMRTNQEVANIYSSIAANNSATSERMHRRALEGIGEYNSFAGMQGTTVQSSIHGGNYVYQNPNDPSQVFSTNNPSAVPPGYIELRRLP